MCQRDRHPGALWHLARRLWPQSLWWRQKVICIRGRSVRICICVLRSVGAVRWRIRIQIHSYSAILCGSGLIIHRISEEHQLLCEIRKSLAAILRNLNPCTFGEKRKKGMPERIMQQDWHRAYHHLLKKLIFDHEEYPI